MLLDRCIAIDRCHVAICFNFYQRINGLLRCVFLHVIGIIFKLWKYYLIVFNIYDIVPRAVEANIRENMPTARTNKRKYEYGEIRFLDIITIFNNCCGNAIAIASLKSSFAVFKFVLQNFAQFKGGDDIFD